MIVVLAAQGSWWVSRGRSGPVSMLLTPLLSAVSAAMVMPMSTGVMDAGLSGSKVAEQPAAAITAVTRRLVWGRGTVRVTSIAQAVAPAH